MLDGKKILLIVRNLSATFRLSSRRLFQTARDSLLVHEKLLKEIQKKEILLHCIVHDLTQPLSAMNSVFHLLDREHLPATLRKYVKAGERESQRQELMIRGILEAFSSDLAAQQCEQRKVSGEAPDLPTAPSAPSAISLPPFRDHDNPSAFGPHASENRRDWRVIGDAARIDRIFGNLLENAMRYSPKGTTVTVGVEDQGGFVLACVDDEGPGLPNRSAARPTFRAVLQRRKQLRQSRPGALFLQNYRGTLGRRDRRGNSRNWRLAVLVPPAASSASRRGRSYRRGAEKNLRRKNGSKERRQAEKSLRILVADDAEINRELIVELLKKRGHLADGVANGRQALAELEQHSFDVVIIDEEMPEMTGLQATAAIRLREATTGKHQIIIGFSGHSTEDDEHQVPRSWNGCIVGETCGSEQTL